MFKKFTRSSLAHLPLRSRIILAVIFVGIIGLAAFMTLNYYIGQSTRKEAAPEQTRTQSAGNQLDALKKSATAKLEAGDQKGGLEDLRAALVIAKTSDNKAEILYLEQQIDFAENTEFTPANNPAPTMLPSSKNKPGFVAQ